MRLLPALAMLALLAASPALGDGRFEALRERAERLDSLEAFLSRYVGACNDPYERRTCLENVAAARRALAGKTFAVRVNDATSLVRVELRGDGFLLLVTPFVDGGGLALTHGQPRSQDAAGHPLISFIPIRGSLPPGTMEMDFQSPFRSGMVEMEIVFRPEGTWKMKRKGEAGYFEGVAARFLGVRLIDARTGGEIAARVL
ncbi:MAG TPA: DUF6066 family protein [Anaeromyxobacteraceae bacterium]|nr:DUF6066 family protein [Anaeromyxobacteraceae bacterium]